MLNNTWLNGLNTHRVYHICLCNFILYIYMYIHVGLDPPSDMGKWKQLKWKPEMEWKMEMVKTWYK